VSEKTARKRTVLGALCQSKPELVLRALRERPSNLKMALKLRVCKTVSSLC